MQRLTHLRRHLFFSDLLQHTTMFGALTVGWETVGNHGQ